MSHTSTPTTSPTTPHRPTTHLTTQPPGAPLRVHPNSLLLPLPTTPPRGKAPIPAQSAPPNQKALTSLSKMRYRWNDPNLSGRYRHVVKDFTPAASMREYAYPVLDMGVRSEPARARTRDGAKKRGEGEGEGKGVW